MKKVLLLSLAILSLSCNNNPQQGQVYVNDVQQSQPTVTVTPEVSNLGDNLDLQALGSLVQKSQNAQDIENSLNSNGSINNLDLDGDGNVDYIKVTEYGSGNTRGFSFTVDLPDNQSQEVATIELNKNGSNAQMNINGNQQLYGQNSNYQSSISVSDLIIMNYLFSRHSYYHSPYRYGYYPRYYHSYRSVPMRSYHTRVSPYRTNSTITRTTTRTISKSPNATKSSPVVSARAKSMAAPVTSQRSFKATTNSRPVTSGFKSSNSSKPASNSTKPRSNSSFGSSSRTTTRPSSSSSYNSSKQKSSSSSARSSSSSRSSFGSSSRSSSSRSSSSRSSRR